jgi:hypothetical protein
MWVAPTGLEIIYCLIATDGLAPTEPDTFKFHHTRSVRSAPSVAPLGAPRP